MSLPSHTQVLIVGAGPAGMTCALTLGHLGLPVTLVDAALDNRNGSRATVIHAHTLEVLHSIGLAKPILEAGRRSKGLVVLRGTERLVDIDIGQLIRGDTEYPYTLLIPQHEVEKILRKHVVESGIEILRPHAVVGIKEAASGGGLDVTFDDGSCVNAQYVVGADGSRSTIRHLANIDFKDPATGVDYDKVHTTSAFEIALADVHFHEPVPAFIPPDAFSFDFEKFVFMSPLHPKEEIQGQSVSFWRIGLWMMPGTPAIAKTPDIDFLQAELDRRYPSSDKPRIAKVHMSSRYRVRGAVAGTMFKKLGEGNILLVGDAAHVHSPVGGQGLNLGLCDAVALGNTIHAHIHANSKAKGSEQQSDRLLTEFSASRRRIALRVVTRTEGVTSFMNSRGLRKVLQAVVFWLVGSVPMLKKAVAWRVSGLSNRD